MNVNTLLVGLFSNELGIYFIN